MYSIYLTRIFIYELSVPQTGSYITLHHVSGIFECHSLLLSSSINDPGLAQTVDTSYLKINCRDLAHITLFAVIPARPC